MTVIVTSDEAGTVAAGRAFGADLQRGDVVLLHGQLGAGKTAFVRGLAAGLGCDPEDVSSPTFSIIQEYRGATTLYHVDLYRLAPNEVPDLGLDDLIDDGVVAIEWPDRWRDAPARARTIWIESLGGDRREIRFGEDGQRSSDRSHHVR